MNRAVRPYQGECIEAVTRDLAAQNRVAVVMATGCGKTRTATEIVRLRRQAGLGRALWLAHRIELVDQAVESLRAVGLTVEIESGDHVASTRPSMLGFLDVVCATVQTLKGRRLERWLPGSFGLIVVDECFPAGTLVDGRPIEDVEIGDMVQCVDHDTGSLSLQPVTHIFKRETSAKMVTLTSGAADVTCTENHPVWVRGKGYVDAWKVEVGDVLCVWDSVRGARQDAASNVLGNVPPEGVVDHDGEHQQGACVSAHAGQEPDAARGGPGARVGKTEGDRPLPEDPWGERARVDGGRTDAFGRGVTDFTIMGGPLRCSYEDAEGVRFPDLLQDRPGAPGDEGGGRSGRAVSRRTEPSGAGRKEGRVLAWARVDRVAVHKQAGEHRTTVYNLEVAGGHTYFANGVLVHNCHHATSASYRTILDHFGSAKVLGLTATPDRGDKVALGHVIPHVSYSYGIRDGIRDGWLCPLRLIQVHAPKLDLSTVRVSRQEHGMDYRAEDIAAQMKDEETLHQMAIPIVKEAGDRPTIAFTPTVEIAHELARVLSGYVGAAKVRSLDGNSAKADRAAALDDFRAGRAQFLVNCALFTEGFDAPSTAAIALLRPTKSRALYTQMIGRGTRTAPGKTDCLILDVANNSDRHSLVHPLDIFAGKELPEDIAKSVRKQVDEGVDVEKALAEGERIAHEREQQRLRDRLKASIVAQATYAKRKVDPFALGAEELGIEYTADVYKGAVAKAWQIEALERHHLLKPGEKVTGKQATAFLTAIKERKTAGLCTIRQARQMRRFGLRDDVSFQEASEIMTTLAKNNWRVPPEISERWSR